MQSVVLFLISAMRENKLNCKHFNCQAQLCRNAVGICLNHLSQTTVSHCFECNCCFPENKKQTYFCCPFSSLNKKKFGRICLLLFLSERNIYGFLDVVFWLCCWKGCRRAIDRKLHKRLVRSSSKWQLII